MAKTLYKFSGLPPGSFSTGGGYTLVTAGPGVRTVTADNYDPNNRFLRFERSRNGQDLVAFDAMNNHGNDTETLTLFRVLTAVQVPGSYGVAFWDYTASNQGLSLGFLPASNVKSLILYDDKAGRTVQFANYDWQNLQKYWLRWRVENGTDHKVKIWPEGTAEPGSWTFTATYANRTTGNHYMGMGSYTANGTVDYYQVGVATGGDTAPMFESDVQPTSTPIAGQGGGYGSVLGYGYGYGQIIMPTVRNTVLAINNSSHSHSVNNITLVQQHTLAATNASHSHTVDAVKIAQVHKLAVNNTTHSQTVESPAIVYNINLTVNGATHSVISDNLALISGLSLVVNNATHSVVSNVVTLVQNHLLSAANTSHSLISDNIVIVESKPLVVSDTTHGHTVDALALTVVHNLVIDNALHGHSVENLVLQQIQTLTINNANHTTKSDNVDIIQFTLLGQPASGVFGIKSDLVVLVQKHTLAIDDAIHRLKSNDFAIIDWDSLGVNFGRYIPDFNRSGVIEEADSPTTGPIRPTYQTSGEFGIAEIDSGQYIPTNINR